MHQHTRNLLQDVERQARERAQQLERAGQLPQGFSEHHYSLGLVELAELQRLKIAFHLAKDVDALTMLLAGLPVDPARLRTDALERACEPRFVQLVPAIDVLHGAAA